MNARDIENLRHDAKSLRDESVVAGYAAAFCGALGAGFHVAGWSAAFLGTAALTVVLLIVATITIIQSMRLKARAEKAMAYLQINTALARIEKETRAVRSGEERVLI